METTLFDFYGNEFHVSHLIGTVLYIVLAPFVGGLIAGIDSEENAKLAITELTARGVIAEVYPFKPNSGSNMADYPITDTDLMMRLSEFADKCMSKENISLDKACGCVKCGACGITQHLRQGKLK